MATKKLKKPARSSGRKVSTGAAKKRGAKAAPKAYECSTCGAVTKDRGHLCSPVPVREIYTCAYCGKGATDPYHVCVPMVTEMKFVCSACGRVTPYRSGVCKPKAIR